MRTEKKSTFLLHDFSEICHQDNKTDNKEAQILNQVSPKYSLPNSTKILQQLKLCQELLLNHIS